MRFWFSGPRFMGIRPGVSFGPGDFRAKPGRASAGQTSTASAPEGSFVYVVRSDANVCKIGISTNPINRIAQLRTGSSFPLEFSFVGVTPGTGAEIEREAHKMLHRHRLAGEWFDVSPEMATTAVMGAAAKLNHKLHPVAPSQIGQIIAIASGTEAMPGTSSGLTPGARVVLKGLVWVAMLVGALIANETFHIDGYLALGLALSVGMAVSFA